MKGIFRVQLDPSSLALGGILGLVAGGAVGYLVARRVLGAAFDERLDSEVASVKAHYNGHLKSLLETGKSYTAPSRDDEDSRATLPDESGDSGELLELSEAIDDDEMVQPEVFNGLNVPSIISAEEFGETDFSWQHLTITWYAGDKVLVDDKEQPIRDIHTVLGFTPVKSMFGGISGDPNIMLVRNPRLEIHFEVVWDDRSYLDVILNYGSPK